jgi:hypothetical protein
MDYYRDFLAALNLIHLRRSLASSGRTVELLMLDQAAEATKARADLLVERKVRRIARLRRRIERLEKQVAVFQAESVGRAVRRTAGRNIRAGLARPRRLLSRWRTDRSKAG